MKLKKFAITEDKTIDWYFDVPNGVHALNTETLVFDNVSEFCKDDRIMVAIDENYLNASPDNNEYDFDEEGISNEIRKLKFDGINIVYTLYTKNMRYLVGYVYEA